MLEVEPTVRKRPKRLRSHRRQRFRSIRQVAQPVMLVPFGNSDLASCDIQQLLCGLRTCSICTVYAIGICMNFPAISNRQKPRSISLTQLRLWLTY